MSDVATIAFTVYGFGVTAEQRDAGLAAMRGTFSNHAVSTALARAGVRDLPDQRWTVERATDRLLQTERKAGRIRAVRGQGRGMWQSLTKGENA